MKKTLASFFAFLLLTSCSWFDPEVTNSSHSLQIDNRSYVPLNITYTASDGTEHTIKVWPGNLKPIYEKLSNATCANPYIDCLHQLQRYGLGSVTWEGEVKASEAVIDDLFSGLRDLTITYSREDTLQYYGYEVVFDTLQIDPRALVDLQSDPFSDPFFGTTNHSYYHVLTFTSDLID